MSKWMAVLALLGAAVAFSACNPDEIPLVGLDASGNSVELGVSKSKYTERMGTLISTVNESAIPALAHRPAAKALQLRTVVVGVGISTEIGLGPFKVGAVPRVRVAFTNSSDPVVP